MIEILLKNEEIHQVNYPDEILDQDLDFYLMKFVDYTDQEVNWAEEKFGIDFSIIKHYEDIEISSHFSANEHQVSFHFSIPYYDKGNNISETPIFVVIASAGLFFFSDSEIDHYFKETYPYKFSQITKLKDVKPFFKFQIEFISDYYADITEIEAKKIKALTNTILLKKDFTNEVMDIITKYSFNNMLVKESLMETTRVFMLYKKSSWEQKIDLQQIVESELNDLAVISDYIQFNFDRLGNLKENVSNKIDLEQNHIFKMLTIVTVCISLPTLIAGVYGMNFENMPELQSPYGYPMVIVAMLFSVALPFIYFKGKKWL